MAEDNFKIAPEGVQQAQTNQHSQTGEGARSNGSEDLQSRSQSETSEAQPAEMQQDSKQAQAPTPSGPATAEEWAAEAKHFQDLYLRSLADSENTRRRFQKDREEALRYAAESVIRQLLPLLDNLNLALTYADTEIPAVKNLAEGVRMTLKGCLDTLAEHGLKEISAEPGQPFDPNFHEALGQEPSPELPDKSVSRLVSKGYSLHQRLLKPAKVIVVKNDIAE
jgi:molecular chaperone GrpE